MMTKVKERIIVAFTVNSTKITMFPLTARGMRVSHLEHFVSNLLNRVREALFGMEGEKITFLEDAQQFLECVRKNLSNFAI